MRRQIITIWLLVVVFSDGCVEPYNAPVVELQPGLVIDALLTDQPSIQTVRLYFSSGLDADLDKPEYISGAIVNITDDAGNVEAFTEVSEGVYESHDNFAGQVGRQYRLWIETETGEQLESDFIEMKPAGEIEAVHYEYRYNAINQGHPELPQDAVDIYVDGKGALNEASLLRWRWRGTYQVHTRPELRTKRDEDGNIVPDPYPCSGYGVDNQGQLRPLFVCECCDCWPTEFSANASVSNNQTINNSFNRVHIGQIPVDQWRFAFKYHLEVEQLSVSDDVYEFWKLVQAQQQGSANIFQPNVVKVKGNVRAVSGDKAVFGIFSVSAVAHSSVDINKHDIPIPPYEPDIIIQDCRHYRENSINVMPPFW